VSKRVYGVRMIRGPVVELPPHEAAEDIHDLEDLLSLKGQIRGPLAADLFCGAGGLSLGLHESGFHVVLGVDNDETAIATHRAHFPGLSLTADLADPDTIREIASTLKRLEVDLIAGGPPCQPFSRAGRSKIRSLVELGTRPSYDERRDLWRSFMEIVEEAQPRAVLIENVPDMALGDDMLVLRRMREELEMLGFTVDARLLDAWKYGVPQHRQRLIVVATREGGTFEWPYECERQTTVNDAIGDLPVVEGGFRHPEGADGAHRYRPGKPGAFQRHAREWPTGELSRSLHDHITRPVRDDDRLAFEQMDATTTYAELDDSLKRYRDDIFVDKYKRLDGNALSRTITAHIARDGYWYIHPEQARTLTIREAARIQTFPDRFRFAGPPSAAFRQIGNAVPPRLGEVIGRQIRAVLDGRSVVRRRNETDRDELVEWWLAQQVLARPWLRQPAGVVPAVIGEVLLDRVAPSVATRAWAELGQLRSAPEWKRSANRVAAVAETAGRQARLGRVEAVLEALSSGERPVTIESVSRLPGVSIAAANNVALAVLQADPIVPLAPAVRVVGKYFGRDLASSRHSHGRMAIAELVGGGDDASQAHLALNEVGALLCRPKRPRCEECPLQAGCRSRER
jgi:DNA (cytosine-5)-methyltransferase 1